MRDPIGIRRASLLKTVSGYRDRVEHLPMISGDRVISIEQQLTLSELGVEPGQILEFYAEAMDTNPNRLGISASEIAKVQIISNEEYAEILRNKSDIREFTERYRIMNEQMQKLIKALAELEEKAKNNEPLDEAVKKALQAANEMKRLADTLEKDFPIFAMEPQLQKIASEMSLDMKALKSALNGIRGSRAAAEQVAKGWKNKLAKAEQGIKKEQENAEAVASVQRVMQMAMLYRAIVNEQEQIVRILNRSENEEVFDSPRFRRLRKRQRENRGKLAQFSKELTERMKEVDAELFPELLESSAKFLAALEQLDPAGEMALCETEAGNEVRSQAHQHAERALDLLREIMSKGGCMGSMCQGECPPTFKVSQNMAETIAQMMNALMNGSGSGNGTATGQGGVGMSGGGDSGYLMNGNTPMNTPMIGPGRSNFGQPQGGGRGQHGSGRGPGAVRTVDHSEGTHISEPDESNTDQPIWNRVPEKYRDAVKKFYTE